MRFSTRKIERIQSRNYSISWSKLKFGRWVKQAPYSPFCGAIAQIPQASRIAQLVPAEQYAAVELFRGTMVRHSMVVYRNDCPVFPQLINSAGDAWRDYVPIRLPDTICFQERLPPGAAAVVINQSHTYRDLFMPINLMEKCWLDAIDGNTCIDEIVDRSPLSQRNPQIDMARAFFERLWWYDQVVFDITTARGNSASRETV
jgi:hypothetical protein